MNLCHVGLSDRDRKWREVESWNWAEARGGMYV